MQRILARPSMPRAAPQLSWRLVHDTSQVFFRTSNVRLFVTHNHPPGPEQTFPNGFRPSDPVTPEIEDLAHRNNQIANDLRAHGRLSPLHFQFPFDSPHIELESVRRGPSLADQYSKFHWCYLVEKAKANELASQGDVLAQDAFRPLQSFVQDPSASLAKMTREYTQVALEGLSCTPALKHVVSECTSLLKERGDLAFHVQVDGMWDDPLTCDLDHYVLLGDRSKLESGALLDPRTAIHQQGRTLTLCDLSHDMDPVPLDQFKLTRTHRGGMQYIINVNVVAFGTATVFQVNTNPQMMCPAAAPATPRASISKKKKGMIVKKLPTSHQARVLAPMPLAVGGSAVVLKYQFIKPVLLRLVSNVIAPDEYERYAAARGLSWKVADVDYMVTSQVWERGRKLAALMQ